ncbi:MAG TPA: GNAT family N-acetyltransferase [Actinomycetota bacterium]|nr:GNAT family N-acetyltransferase [Actinomycetota bacterium]
MARQIRDLTHTNIDDVPRPCRGCVFWEYAPADRALTLGAHDADFEKEAWSSEVSLVNGNAGKVCYVDGAAAGFALCGPPDMFHGADVFPLRISRDALFLATLRILPEYVGMGVGKALVHAVLKEAKARGKRAIEAYGDRNWQHEACIVPGPFLEAIGFRVKRDHPRFPLYRLDLSSVAKMTKNVEAAVEAFLEAVFSKDPVPQKAPSR